MQIDDDNSKMMTAIMRMVSAEFYAGCIHMHQMADMCEGMTTSKGGWQEDQGCDGGWGGTRFWHPGRGD